jgi:DNA-binding CsgD family transcriptional regulator
MRLPWPLTGRSTEMRLIGDAISDPDVSGIVISGAAGVGKSRVAREALAAAGSDGHDVRWVVGTNSGRTVPLGALAAWVGPGGGGDSLKLVRQVIESLTSDASGRRVVVAVDDVPLLDELSTFVVEQVIQRRAAKVVFTVRDDESVTPTAQGLWKRGQFARLDLQPLSRDETTALVSAAVGGALDPQAARRLWELTRGNVLYLRNIVDQEVAEHRIVEEHGFWRWIGEPVVPPGLVELIESRIGALPTSVSDVIDALAVGEPIELGSLARMTHPAAVEEADLRGLIMLDRTNDRVEARIAHPLYGEVRRKRAAPIRLRRLRGLVANELAGSQDRDELRVVVRRATLSLESDLEPDADLLVSAARGAIWMWDLALADRLAGAAIRIGGPVQANFIRSYALSCLGHGLAADAVLRDIPVGELTDVDRARLAFHRATNRLFTLLDPAGAKELIDDALQTTPPEARSSVYAFLTVYWAVRGKPDAVVESSKNFVWDELSDILIARLTAWALTVAAGDAGRTSEAVAAAEAGYPVPIRSFVIITDGHTSALLLAGEIAKTQYPAQLLRLRASDIPDPASQFTLLADGLAGRAHLGAGDLGTACSMLEPIVRLLIASGDPNGWGYRCRIPYTTALAMRGLSEQAAASLAVLDAQQHPTWQYLDYEYSIAKAWVAASQGAVSEAITTVLSAAETARTNGQFAAEVMCLQTATQFGEPSCGARLVELQEIVEGPRVGVAARFAAALQRADARELGLVSKDFERMGDLVAAADAAAHAALIYRRRDLRGSSLAYSARAEELARRCAGAVTPALRQGSERLPLTDREREVVMLIGEGMSNRDIAIRLTVSIRTVETHVYRAMAKTDTATRDELATLLTSRRTERE